MNAVALYPWLLTPVVMVVLTVLAFNFLGDGLGTPRTRTPSATSAVDRNLHRYIIRRSLRLQLVLIAISLRPRPRAEPLMLNLQKRIINEAIGQRNFDALLWLCGGFPGAVLANGAFKYVKQNLEGYISETMLRDLRTSCTTGSCGSRCPPEEHLDRPARRHDPGRGGGLGGYFGLALSTPAFHGAMLVGTLGFMVYANPWMALVSMVLFRSRSSSSGVFSAG